MGSPAHPILASPEHMASPTHINLIFSHRYIQLRTCASDSNKEAAYVSHFWDVRITNHWQRTRALEEQHITGPQDQRRRGPGDQNTRGPEDQRTRGPKDQRTRGPADQRTRDQRTSGPADQANETGNYFFLIG